MIFKHLTRLVLVATTPTMKVWGKFSSFSFNKLSLKSYQVELVDFEYRLHEGEKYQNQALQRRYSQIYALTAAQQEIYVSKRLRDIDINFMWQP